ncbi:MAG TPA: hypothetical protein VLN58_14000, partial [Verrucomicrobiae bacterium]|nr:hypothetical protein [Verrucomicrobiae bacterium]
NPSTKLVPPFRGPSQETKALSTNDPCVTPGFHWITQDFLCVTQAMDHRCSITDQQRGALLQKTIQT